MIKRILPVIILLAVTAQAFALNPSTVSIEVAINQPPYIGDFVPTDGSVITEGATLEVSVTAGDPNTGDILKYQYYINNVVKQAWTTASTFNYTLTTGDIGLNDIYVKVTDDIKTVQSQTAQVYVFRNTVGLP
jgi:hypothetical protein